jgi:hypothetical protein
MEPLIIFGSVALVVAGLAIFTARLSRRDAGRRRRRR